MQPFGKLTLIVNGAPETEYTLAKGTVTLGRAADNDIVLADRLASRHHAQLVCAPDGCEFVDLGSSNGSWVGGQRVARRALREGDVVAVVELHSALTLPPALAGGLEGHLGTNSQPSGAHTSWA